MTTPARKVLAAASSGGHWVQLLRVTEALADQDVAYLTVSESYRAEVPGRRVHVVNDASRWSRLGSLAQAVRVLAVLLRERPDVVLSTGASVGLFAVAWGRLLGARTIWLDSIANADVVSLSGRLARPFAQLWLTQWPELAVEGGPEYAGRVF